jgi:hypothetical protein
MRFPLRSTAPIALAALVGLATLGASPAAARAGDLIPAPTPRPLTFSIHDAEVLEGDPGDGHVLSFEITGSRSSAADVTLRAHTGNLGFEATPGVDFTPIDEIVTMPAGATSTTVEVPVIGDTDPEPEELVIIWLSDPSSGSIALSGSTALGRILDDDTPQPPTIHISQPTLPEGTGDAYTPFVFTVSLSHPTNVPVSVDLLPIGGTAQYGVDFIAPAMTVVIPAGATSTDYVASVIADAIAEDDEQFIVEMSNAVGGTIVGGAGLATILDDDGRRFDGPGDFTAQWGAAALAIGLRLILNG